MPGKKILFYSNELQSQIKLYELIIASCRVNLDLYEFSSPIAQHTSNRVDLAAKIVDMAKKIAKLEGKARVPTRQLV